MSEHKTEATTWRYEFVTRVNTRTGTERLDGLCDEGWEPFAVTEDGAGSITVHVRRQENISSGSETR